jgi:peptide/nickel transport system substrate-binding protein
LKEIGIQADIQLIEWAAFIKEFVKPRRFEVVVLGLGTGVDPDQFVVWHSSQRGPDQMNRTGYDNPEVDRLLEAGRMSCSQNERVKYYHRIQEILAGDLPMIFLYYRDLLPVVASRVRGVTPSPSGIMYNFNEWYVPKIQQRYTSG